jgi:hypothetical protein
MAGKFNLHDYAAFKAAFHKRALARGIDPLEGATGYQARMQEIARAGTWRVRLRFVVPGPDSPTLANAHGVPKLDVITAVHRPTEDDAIARVMPAPLPPPPDAIPVDGVSLRTLYPAVRAQFLKDQLMQSLLQQGIAVQTGAQTSFGRRRNEAAALPAV